MRWTSAGRHGLDLLHERAQVVRAEAVQARQLQLLDDAAARRVLQHEQSRPCSCGCRPARPRAAARSAADPPRRRSPSSTPRSPRWSRRRPAPSAPPSGATDERAVRRVGVALLLADVGGDARGERAAEQRIGHAQRDVVRMARIDHRQPDVQRRLRRLRPIDDVQRPRRRRRRRRAAAPPCPSARTRSWRGPPCAPPRRRSGRRRRGARARRRSWRAWNACTSACV